MHYVQDVIKGFLLLMSGEYYYIVLACTSKCHKNWQNKTWRRTRNNLWKAKIMALCTDNRNEYVCLKCAGRHEAIADVAQLKRHQR